MAILMTCQYFNSSTFIIVFLIVNFISLSNPSPFCCCLLILLLGAYFINIAWIFIGAIFIAIGCCCCCLFWRMNYCCLSSFHWCFSNNHIPVWPDFGPYFLFPTSLPTSIDEFITIVYDSLSSMLKRHLVDRLMSGRGLGTFLCLVSKLLWDYITLTMLSTLLCTVYTQPWSFSTPVFPSSSR